MNFDQIEHHVHQLPVVMVDVTSTISTIKEDLNQSVSWQWTTVWDTVCVQSLKQAAIKTYNLWLTNVTLNTSLVILSDADFTELQRESTTPADSQIFWLNGNKIFYLTRYMIVFWIAIAIYVQHVLPVVFVDAGCVLSSLDSVSLISTVKGKLFVSVSCVC